MPSNECTNTLMELSFALGNMIGAEACDKADYVQLQGILNAWECSRRGKTGDEYDNIKLAVSTAERNCDAAGACLPADCENIWKHHNDLVQEMGMFEVTSLGRGKRASIPPKVKGQEGISRELSLQQLQSSTNWPTAKASETPVTETQIETPATPRQRRAAAGGAEAAGRYGSYGKEEEKRWYPQRLAR